MYLYKKQKALNNLHIYLKIMYLSSELYIKNYVILT